MERIGFVGAGHMGGAMLRGLAAAEPRPALRVFDAAPGRAAALASELGAETADSPADLAAGCDAVVLAVRPGDLPGVLAALGDTAPLFLSIAAGRRLAWLEGRLPAGARTSAFPSASARRPTPAARARRRPIWRSPGASCPRSETRCPCRKKTSTR